MHMLTLQLLPDHSVGKPSLDDGGAVISQKTVPKCQIKQVQSGKGRLQHTAVGEQYSSVSHWNVG